MTAESYIREHAEEIGGKVHIAPDIPEKKLNTAVAAIAPGLDPAYVVALADSTILGSGKCGAILTGEKLFLQNVGHSSAIIELCTIERAAYEAVEGKKGSKKETVFVCLKDGTIQDISDCLIGLSLEGTAQFINGLVENVSSEEDFSSSSQLCPLSAMPSDVKMAYVRLLCNFAFSDDGKISPEEYAEIISLMVRIEMAPADRMDLRGYMISAEQIQPSEKLFADLTGHLSESTCGIALQSLMKDILYLYRKVTGGQEWRANATLCEFQKHCMLDDTQVGAIWDAIILDEEILQQRKNDSEIQKAMKDIGAKVAAVGIPMAAVYFSGSVLGVSASGLTSGLAALGMGGVLGFSSMVTGIGVALLIGVGTYQGAKKLTGLKDLENNKQRELMLQEIIRNSQRSLNILIEDVNEISQQLSTALSEKNESAVKLNKLAAILSMMTRSAQVTTDRIQYAERESAMTRLPVTMSETDRKRVSELTSEPTKAAIREMILSAYAPVEVEENSNGKPRYALREDMTEFQLEQLHNALQSIGYFKLSDAAVASVKSAAKDVLSSVRR